MCLRPVHIRALPEQIARVASTAFPEANPYLTMRDGFRTLFEDRQSAAHFPACGQPAAARWRLALVNLLQFAEEFSDRQAAEAVRARLDWNYLLGVELDDAGFDASVLCSFGARLLAGGAARLLFETLLERFRERKLLKLRGRPRTDSTHVLAAIRAMNRLEGCGEALRHARDASLWTATVPLWGGDEDAPAAPAHRHGTELRPRGPLLGQNPGGQDPAQRLRSPDAGTRVTAQRLPSTIKRSRAA